MKTRYDYGDLVMRTAIEQAAEGFDLPTSRRVIKAGLVALEKQMTVLETADYAGVKPEIVARAAAYVAKVVDEVSRLQEFIEGRPDSRREVLGMGAVLDLLTTEQLDALEAHYLHEHESQAEPPLRIQGEQAELVEVE